jgi:hypothetical protein
MEMVVLILYGSPVVKVPVINFQTFATDRIRQLETVIADAGNQRCNFYTCDASALEFKEPVENWASWLTHRDLRAFDDDDRGWCLRVALYEAELIGDVDYQDVLVDALILWLQDGVPAGSVDIDRLRRYQTVGYPPFFEDLQAALILHHDTEAALTEEKGKLKYEQDICKMVREMAIRYFSRSEREPKDPLQLSDDEFCKTYHTHHKNGQPSYKTKHLPQKT